MHERDKGRASPVSSAEPTMYFDQFEHACILHMHIRNEYLTIQNLFTQMGFAHPLIKVTSREIDKILINMTTQTIFKGN